jgi:MinD-like ATPase involved in chromosome partitioning or flagellar assembly
MTIPPPTRIGKTTVAACVRSIFAQVRHDDRVVAIHADTAFGTFGARVDPHASGS